MPNVTKGFSVNASFLHAWLPKNWLLAIDNLFHISLAADKLFEISWLLTIVDEKLN